MYGRCLMPSVFAKAVTAELFPILGSDYIRFLPLLFLCADSCVYVFFELYCLTAYVLYYCNTVGWAC